GAPHDAPPPRLCPDPCRTLPASASASPRDLSALQESRGREECPSGFPSCIHHVPPAADSASCPNQEYRPWRRILLDAATEEIFYRIADTPCVYCPRRLSSDRRRSAESCRRSA